MEHGYLVDEKQEYRIALKKQLSSIYNKKQWSGWMKNGLQRNAGFAVLICDRKVSIARRDPPLLVISSSIPRLKKILKEILKQTGHSLSI